MKLWMRGRALLAAFPALAIGSLMLSAGALPTRADAVGPGMALSADRSDTTTYADDGDKGKKKGDKGGTEPIIIGTPIIVPDPPKSPPKKDK
jgi:hypothetical protein